MIYLRQGRLNEAITVFERGLNDCPFSASRPYFASALAVARVRRREWREAEAALAGRTDEVAQVLRLHIQGEQGQYGLAIQTYQSLSATPRPAVKGLRDTLVGRFLNPTARRQPASDEWVESVFRQECDLVSVIAA
jgi:hypothetical protein